MKIPQRFTPLALISTLCACANLPHSAVPTAESPAAVFRPAFTISGGAPAHVIAAIENGRQTAVVFDTDRYSADILGADGHVLPFTHFGSYAVLEDTFQHLTVRSAGHVAELDHYGPASAEARHRVAAQPPEPAAKP